MKWGKIWGIRIIVNDYFLLLLLGYALLGVLEQTLLLFFLVFCHELSHLLVASHYGLKAKEVELFPFGGVARVDGMLELSPETEFKVAIAGPLSNLLIYGITYLNWPGLSEKALGGFFLEANLVLGIFNLLPALPLDGGRMLRAALAKKIGFYRATAFALSLSKILAISLGLWGLAGIYFGFSNLHSFFLAVFLFGAAVKEEENFLYLFLRYLLRKGEELKNKGLLPLKQFIATKGVPLGEVVRKFTPGYYHIVLIAEKGGESFYSVSEHQVVNGLLEHGKDFPIGRLTL